MARTYHIGFSAPNGINGDTLVIEARRDVDYLSCELWQYRGERETTKRALHEVRFSIMELVNRENGTTFSHVRVD
jgi:hypothetical protein